MLGGSGSKAEINDAVGVAGFCQDVNEMYRRAAIDNIPLVVADLHLPRDRNVRFLNHEILPKPSRPIACSCRKVN